MLYLWSIGKSGCECCKPWRVLFLGWLMRREVEDCWMLFHVISMAEARFDYAKSDLPRVLYPGRSRRIEGGMTIESTTNDKSIHA